MSARIWQERRLRQRRARVGKLVFALNNARTHEQQGEAERRLNRAYARLFHPPRRTRIWLAS
jgi:hypothetical protein